MNCNCNGCNDTHLTSILQRLNQGCNCYRCKRKNIYSVYYSCIELHFYYQLNFTKNEDIKIKKIIKEVKTNYERKKRLFKGVIKCINKFLNLLFEIQYRPGGSEYQKLKINFYKVAKEHDNFKN